jgi:hypothetical protein
MTIYTRIVAAVAAGLIFTSSAVLGDNAPPQPDKQSAPAQNPRSYTSEDLNRTGKTSVAGALPLLDPSITVRH